MAEDREGARWEVECLGEPVEVGARIAFEPVGRGATGRGVLVRVDPSSREAWVCTLRRARGRLELTPFAGLEAPPLRLLEADAQAAPDGSRVVVVPKREGRADRSRRKAARSPRRATERALPVRVVEVLGAAGDPDADHRALCFKHRLPSAFSRRARLEAEAIDPDPTGAERSQRLDLRALPFVTIDPARARDHDDAVYAEPRPADPVRAVDAASAAPVPSGRAGRAPGYTHRLWVAIADVAHFVAEGGFVDAEARRRGNSFYFPDRAVPMLPERLSSDLCSLRPDEDRRALVVELRLDAEGRVLDALFHEALIRSRARLAYEEAAAWLEAQGTGRERDAEPEWGTSLRCLAELAERLRRARQQAGAVELDLPEVEVVLDAEGRPCDARVRERNPAHRWIEEAMLAANRAVAAALVRAGHETLHRVHPEPSPTRLAALSALLERHGLEAGEALEEPGELARVLESARGHPAEERIHGATLRAMAQARYEPRSGGHFALCFDHYLHFTSPIRRYADLEVHRSLRRLIRGEPPERGQDARSGDGSAAAGEASASERLAIWLSARERVAMEAERDALALACCVMLRGREGERFPARVTAATEYGLFVRLDSPAASGLVPMRWLEGEWRHDAEEEVLIGPRSGARLGVGDRVEVRLVDVDLDRGRLAFALERTGGEDAEPRGRRRGARSKGPTEDRRRGSRSKGPTEGRRRGSRSKGPTEGRRRGSRSRGPSGDRRRGRAPRQASASSRAASSSERRSHSR
ncbi:MAG: VacB/RNase II family 3'-5' exoribonuclease [Spirochaetaceae bacterium]|nr:VacB/RNase II family 3'-5' exoribonuclease [Myxococcales bacterium]MCB9722873.1 VacB/RNase II family 3'-5' exoribonuclease [Spirochaetaceae bacterium]